MSMAEHQVFSCFNGKNSLTAEKKLVYINLLLYSDSQARRIADSMFALFGKHVPAAKPVFLFSKACIPQDSPKGRLASNFDYLPNRLQISCDCGAVFMGGHRGRLQCAPVIICLSAARTAVTHGPVSRCLPDANLTAQCRFWKLYSYA